MRQSKENLSDKAYNKLKKAILFGKLKQNEVISINSLSDELEISRTPITNAFKN